MFPLASLSKKKKFTRVAIASFVLHLYDCMTLQSFLSRLCCNCVALVSLMLHSCCIFVTRITLLLHLSVTNVVKQQRSFPNRYFSASFISLFSFCFIKIKHFTDAQRSGTKWYHYFFICNGNIFDVVTTFLCLQNSSD